MKIGPGMAPKAKLYAYRVFGCAGSTDVVGEAIDMAADPNGDGDTSDHVDVINMSLGSDYGSPQDGDSIVTNDAAQLGITMSVASGNGGDLYDVGGSPGNAPAAIAVAASQDASSVVDSLNVTAPASIAGRYAAERSVAYDWTTKPDLSGDVVRVTQPGNLDGCQPLNTADAAAVAGHIAFVEWTRRLDHPSLWLGRARRQPGGSRARPASSTPTTRRPSPPASPAARSSPASWWRSPVATPSAPSCRPTTPSPSAARRSTGSTSSTPR